MTFCISRSGKDVDIFTPFPVATDVVLTEFGAVSELEMAPLSLLLSLSVTLSLSDISVVVGIVVLF
ncbi:hypothetical protein ACN9TC_13345 [Lactococcus lactis]